MDFEEIDAINEQAAEAGMSAHCAGGDGNEAVYAERKRLEKSFQLMDEAEEMGFVTGELVIHYNPNSKRVKTGTFLELTQTGHVLRANVAFDDGVLSVLPIHLVPMKKFEELFW